MAINDLAPSFVKLFYESPNGPHTMTIPVDAYEFAADTWYLRQKGNSTGQIWDFLVDEYVDVLRALMDDGVTFQYAELYTKSIDEDPTFVTTAALNLAGTSTAGTRPATTLTVSFRTAEGGNGKVVLVDQVRDANLKLLPPSFSGATEVEALADYLVSSSSIVLGRDTSYPIQVTKALTKTNDALRKKYNLV